MIEILSPGDESRAKLPWYAARNIREILLVEPATRRAELYTSRDGTATLVADSATGPVELAAVGATLSTVRTDDGPRLRVDVAGTVTDI